MKIIFIGHSGYNYPHVRVRCYNFSSSLAKLGMDTEVFSYKDHLLSPEYDEEMMYLLSDKRKIQLSLKGIFKLFPEKDNIFYIQKLLFSFRRATDTFQGWGEIAIFSIVTTGMVLTEFSLKRNR